MNWISELKENEIFVFGSNLAGIHGAGAARLAYDKFGAVWGQGVGLAGQTYAIPTKDERVVTLPLNDIKVYVEDFIGHCRIRPDLKFLVTPIGCGLAGYSPHQISPMFEGARNLDNVVLPKEFERKV